MKILVTEMPFFDDGCVFYSDWGVCTVKDTHCLLTANTEYYSSIGGCPYLQVTKEEKENVKMNNYCNRVCYQCGSDDVHSIEIRSESSTNLQINTVNNDTESIGFDDLPTKLEGYYCNSCESLVSLKKERSTPLNRKGGKSYVK